MFLVTFLTIYCKRTNLLNEPNFYKNQTISTPIDNKTLNIFSFQNLHDEKTFYERVKEKLTGCAEHGYEEMTQIDKELKENFMRLYNALSKYTKSPKEMISKFFKVVANFLENQFEIEDIEILSDSLQKIAKNKNSKEKLKIIIKFIEGISGKNIPYNKIVKSIKNLKRLEDSSKKIIKKNYVEMEKNGKTYYYF